MKNTITQLLFTVLVLLAANICTRAQGIQAGAGMKAPIESIYFGFGIPQYDDVELLPQLSHMASKNESENESELQAIKEAKMKLKRAAAQNEVEYEEVAEKKTRAQEPVVVAGYNALGNQGTPSDNTIAVNKSGRIIALVNSSMRTYNTSNGTGATSTVGIQNFFSTLSNGNLLSTNTCDPKVIYDSHSDRFIVFAQTCAGNSSTSQLLLAFSKTSNPSDGWYFYGFTGNPSSSIGQNVWFDYPKIGVSDHDVFVTGNMFNNSMNYVQSVIYQIDKTKCYAGNTLVNGDAVIWYNIGGTPFTMVPMSNGQNGGYGNNMYLVSTDQSWGGTSLHVYEITGIVQGTSTAINEQFIGLNPGLGEPADALQSGTSIELQTGDTRGMDGFYLNGTIHYVCHYDADNQYTGIFYSRLKKDGSNNWYVDKRQAIKMTNTDCAYPSIVSFGHHQNDQSALIHFLASSSSTFPSMRAVFVNNEFVASNSVLVRAGSAFVDVLGSSGKTRWGDYSGLTREMNATVPTAWAFGMVGNSSNAWTNHFAKITTSAWATNTEDLDTKANGNQATVYPNPIVNDTYSTLLNLTENGLLEIKLYDLSGRFIKNIYKTQAFKGDNLFSFQKGGLANGQYILKITLDNELIKNEKISISSN